MNFQALLLIRVFSPYILAITQCVHSKVGIKNNLNWILNWVLIQGSCVPPGSTIYAPLPSNPNVVVTLSDLSMKYEFAKEYCAGKGQQLLELSGNQEGYETLKGLLGNNEFMSWIYENPAFTKTPSDLIFFVLSWGSDQLEQASYCLDETHFFFKSPTRPRWDFVHLYPTPW